MQFADPRQLAALSMSRGHDNKICFMSRLARTLGPSTSVFRRIHRAGIIACQYRAAEWRHKEIELAANPAHAFQPSSASPR
jgi:hypothetical protein